MTNHLLAPWARDRIEPREAPKVAPATPTAPFPLLARPHDALGERLHFLNEVGETREVRVHSLEFRQGPGR